MEKISKRLPIEQTRITAEELWNKVGISRRISEKVTDKGHRIALSVLYSYPNAKSNSEIMDESDLSKDDVYDHLSGRRGTMKDWFVKMEEGSWILTRFGEYQIPALVESYMSILNNRVKSET